jgi:hypothetical protein
VVNGSTVCTPARLDDDGTPDGVTDPTVGPRRLGPALLLTVALGSLAPGIAHSDPPSYLPKGVFVLVPSGASAPARGVLSNREVTGLQIRATWASLQPADGPPNFTYFDGLIAKAKAHNKTVIIAVDRGLEADGLPSWLTAPLFTCSDGSRGPMPWDRDYQRAWQKLWVALVRRYEKVPTVVGYHIGGIYSWNTSDWDLCDATESDRENWLAAGYNVGEIREFALGLARVLSANTRKPFVLPVASTMNDDGVPGITRTTDPEVIVPLYAAYGPDRVDGLPPQFGIMRTTFRATTPDPLGIWNHYPLDDQFATLYEWRPEIAGQRFPAAMNVAQLTRVLDISLHYRVQFMELAAQQVMMPGAARLLSCYRRALVLGTPQHCGH